MSTYKVQFEEKPIAAIQTVAEVLRYSRESLGLDLEDIARDLQISPMYLKSLEEGAYSNLPCKVYTRNFVKCYGQHLGLETQALISLFEQEWDLFSKHQQQLLNVEEKKGVHRTHMWAMPRWIRWGASALMIIAIFSYLGMELYALRQPPVLLVSSPEEEVITEKQIIEISGQTEPEVALSINDQTILSDAEGNFTEVVALQPGLNIVEIEAKKKYSQANTIYRKIMVEERPVITDANTQDSQTRS
jgi:cytoskeletal protein RodZ